MRLPSVILCVPQPAFFIKPTIISHNITDRRPSLYLKTVFESPSTRAFYLQVRKLAAYMAHKMCIFLVIYAW